MKDFVEALGQHPVIAAVRDWEGIRAAADSAAAAIFVLGGSILTLPDMALAARGSGKRVFLHLDLMEGLGHDQAAVEWCARTVRPDGLISTRAPLLKKASELGLITIQRLFLMDSSSMQSGVRLLRNARPDMVELLPGLVPKAIRELKQALSGTPVIAGGMVTERPEVEQALAAGALAVSSSRPTLWNLARRDIAQGGPP